MPVSPSGGVSSRLRPMGASGHAANDHASAHAHAHTPAHEHCPGLLLLICGPSGVGKTTIVHELIRRFGGLFSISATTRQRSPQERDGVDYFFIDERTFQEWIAEDRFLEHAQVFGRAWYGTPEAPVRAELAKGHLVVLDINLETGDTVRCAFDGKVRIAQISKSYGFVVVVRHNNGLETYYAHLSKLLVKPGDEMEAGMILGLGGNTGHSFGSHLHFETRFRGIAIDPSNLINFQTQTLHTDTYNLTKSDFKYLAEQYKIRHYSRKRKKTWYTYYCPGGASYSTPAAKAIMAKVPKPTLPTKNATAVNVANNGNHSAPTKPITKEATSTTPKKPVVQPKKTTSTAKTPKKAETQTGKPIYYTIKSGDSLYSIAIKYKTTVPKICALNGIKAKDILSIGKKLRVN